jgi:hypothetical protein
VHDRRGASWTSRTKSLSDDLDDNPIVAESGLKKEGKKRKKRLENPLGRGNIPLEIEMRDSRSSLSFCLRRKNWRVFDDRRMSLRIGQVAGWVFKH